MIFQTVYSKETRASSSICLCCISTFYVIFILSFSRCKDTKETLPVRQGLALPEYAVSLRRSSARWHTRHARLFLATYVSRPIASPRLFYLAVPIFLPQTWLNFDYMRQWFYLPRYSPRWCTASCSFQFAKIRRLFQSAKYFMISYLRNKKRRCNKRRHSDELGRQAQYVFLIFLRFMSSSFYQFHAAKIHIIF